MYQVKDGKIEYQDGLAYILFHQKSNTIFIDKVFVDETLRGQKIASKLMKYAYEYFSTQNFFIECNCSYAKNWVDKNVKSN